MRLLRAIDNRANLPWSLQHLGRIALHRGDYRAARAYYAEALMLLQERGHRFSIATCLTDLAGVSAWAGPHPEGARRTARLLGAAEALRADIQIQLIPVLRVDRERNIAAARAHLTDDEWSACWAEGRAMSLDEALADALEGEGQDPGVDQNRGRRLVEVDPGAA